MVEPSYTADPASGFHSVRLDSLTAIYHRRSGVTHVVAEPVPEIIVSLAGKQLNVAELCVALIGDHALVEGDETRRALQARLDELEEVGLVSLA